MTSPALPERYCYMLAGSGLHLYVTCYLLAKVSHSRLMSAVSYGQCILVWCVFTGTSVFAQKPTSWATFIFLTKNKLFLFVGLCPDPRCRKLQEPQADAQWRETVQVFHLQQGVPPGVQPDIPHAHTQRQEAVHLPHLWEGLLQELWPEETHQEAARPNWTAVAATGLKSNTSRTKKDQVTIKVTLPMMQLIRSSCFKLRPVNVMCKTGENPFKTGPAKCLTDRDDSQSCLWAGLQETILLSHQTLEALKCGCRLLTCWKPQV